MILVGVNVYHGDAAAVAVADGKVVYAIEEERLNRVKHSAGLPEKAFVALFKPDGTPPEDVSTVTIARNPRVHLIRKALFVLRNHPPFGFLKERFKVSFESKKISSFLISLLQCNGRWNAGHTGVEHHLAHAASAFYPSGFDRAALLTVDGFGDFSSVLFGVGEGNRIKVLKQILFPNSLGVLFTAATQFLGFEKYGDEYKVMGLVAYGEPRFMREFRQLIHLEKEGAFKLDVDYFRHPRGEVDMTWASGEPVLGRLYSEKWQDLFGEPRHPEQPITQRDKDLASSTQLIFEETLFHLLKYLHQETKIENLCFAGGCALNSFANGKIFDRTPFRNVYIQPAAGDAGTALGSALYHYHHRLNKPRNFVMNHAYWGPEFTEGEINHELRMKNEELKKANCSIEKIQEEGTLCKRAAQTIAKGKIVGWFQGRMEWGPRALGNRSILADPRRKEMKEILNAKIKLRENFRPFAPSVLEEKANDWLEMKTPTSPFMNLVFPVRSEKRSLIPAVTHIDGTARVHTVSKETNPLFWNLIHEFEIITGVPMLLNTSFNENEPIVCTPADALNCYLRTKMDILVLGPYWIERRI